MRMPYLVACLLLVIAAVLIYASRSAAAEPVRNAMSTVSGESPAYLSLPAPTR